MKWEAVVKRKDNMNKKGWVLSNNERNDVVIQRDDEVGRFKNDDEATEFVVKSYDELLSACKNALSQLQSNLCDITDYFEQKHTRGEIEYLEEIINKAEGIE